MVDGEKTRVDSRDEGKHTGRNDLLYVRTESPATTTVSIQLRLLW